MLHRMEESSSSQKEARYHVLGVFLELTQGLHQGNLKLHFKSI